MAHSPSVLTAATTLAEWARERRRVWSDVPLDIPAPPVALAEEPVVFERTDFERVDEAVLVEEDTAVDFVEPDLSAHISAPQVLTLAEEEVVHAPPATATWLQSTRAVLQATWKGLAVCAKTALVIGRALGALLVVAVESLSRLREPAVRWLARGAAIASIASVGMVIAINRGELFTRWDRVAAMVVAAANRPPDPPPAPVTLPKGAGRLTVASTSGEATVLVDGTARGPAPLTLILPAGAHRVLLRSPDGSVERTVRIQAGESSEINEAIYPGWVALTTSIDVSLSEGGRVLKRDDRGWAILPPGPHEIHLDNRALGVHEVRRVVVTPGDTTRLSFAPHTSMLSLTTNEPAEVWIDGVPYGQAPLVEQPIAIGMHDVRVRSALHERWVRIRATVQPVTINVDLTAS